MKRVLCIMLLCVVAVLSGCSSTEMDVSTEDTFDYRMHKWANFDLSEGEVRQMLEEKEGVSPGDIEDMFNHEEEEQLTNDLLSSSDPDLRQMGERWKERLKDRMFSFEHKEFYRGCKVKEIYAFFGGNSLNKVEYNFLFDETSGVGKNEYYEIYKECEKQLTKAFGKPKSSEEKWNDDRYKNDPYMIYKAIEEGDYEANAEWEFDNMRCVVALNGEYGLSVIYSHK